MSVAAVEIDQVLGKGARLGDDRTIGSQGKAGSVEDQAVVASHLVHHDDRSLVPGGDRGQHAVAQFPLTPVIRGGGDVEDERSPGAHQLFDRVDGIEAAGPEALIVPGIFADGEGQALVSQAVQVLDLCGSKIALLVEDVVEGQKPFGLDELHHPIAQQRSRIGYLLARSRGRCGDVAADDGQWVAAGRCGGNLRDGLRGPRHKGWLIQKIGRRVTANCQLREHDNVRLGCGSLPGELDDFLRISLKIPNRGVDLGKSDLHFYSLSTVVSGRPVM